MSSSTCQQNLNILFFPLMAQGHMLPMVDMAKLFAARGTTVTILTTPKCASLILPTINFPIQLHLIPLPSTTEDTENTSFASPDAQFLTFTEHLTLLREPFDHVLKDIRPDCVISDVFLPWTYEVAANNGIPRISFFGTSLFALCCIYSIERHHVLASMQPKDETFIIPGLPHSIEMLRSQLRDPSKLSSYMKSLMEVIKHAREVDLKNYGMVVNSFYELEPDYTEHYKRLLGKKAWHVGPVALCNREEVDKLTRGGGGGSKGGEEEWLKWLDGRKARSVVYMCFGSRCDFTAGQLREMALGLEDSGYQFLWAVRNAGEDWIPQG